MISNGATKTERKQSDQTFQAKDIQKCPWVISRSLFLVAIESDAVLYPGSCAMVDGIPAAQLFLPSPGKLPPTWVWMCSSTGIPHAPQGKPRDSSVGTVGTSTLCGDGRWVWRMECPNGCGYTMLYHVIPLP